MSTSSAFKKTIFYGLHILLIFVVSFVYLFVRNSDQTDQSNVLGVSSVPNAYDGFESADVNESPVLSTTQSFTTSIASPNNSFLEENKIIVIGVGLAFLLDSFVTFRYRRSDKTDPVKENKNSYQLFNLQQS